VLQEPLLRLRFPKAKASVPVASIMQNTKAKRHNERILSIVGPLKEWVRVATHRSLNGVYVA
jgi:hypothetical protein